MNNWDFTPPPPSDLGDHDVPREGSHLEGKRIALLITGGIASMKAIYGISALLFLPALVLYLSIVLSKKVKIENGS